MPWPAQACLSAYGYGRRGVFSTSDSPLSYGRGEVLCSVLASSFVVLCFALLPFYIASSVPTLRFFRARFFVFAACTKLPPPFAGFTTIGIVHFAHSQFFPLFLHFVFPCTGFSSAKKAQRFLHPILVLGCKKRCIFKVFQKCFYYLSFYRFLLQIFIFCERVSPNCNRVLFMQIYLLRKKICRPPVSPDVKIMQLLPNLSCWQELHDNFILLFSQSFSYSSSPLKMVSRSSSFRFMRCCRFCRLMPS